jgi:hypothetical protein
MVLNSRDYSLATFYLLNLLREFYENISYMYKRNNNINNAKLSQWFPNGRHKSRIFSIKVRRTYGLLCPCGNYKSNRWSNTQRHIDRLHGSGEPIDSRTGETRAEKKAGVPATHSISALQSSSIMPAPNVVIPAKPKELSGNKIVNAHALIPTVESENIQVTQNASLHATDEGSYSMPFLDAQERRVTELGYGIRMPSQSFLPPSTIQTYRFGRTGVPSLGNVRMSGNIDSRFSGPNMHTLDQGIQSYQNNSSGDYVDLLAPHCPAIAILKRGREIANLFSKE